jgi:hypothetical protein
LQSFVVDNPKIAGSTHANIKETRILCCGDKQGMSQTLFYKPLIRRDRYPLFRLAEGETQWTPTGRPFAPSYQKMCARLDAKREERRLAKALAA